jgi:chloride channel protein, CIC family
MSDAAAGGKVDPGEMIRSKEYRRLLVIAAFIGILVSLVSWGFLELVHWLQQAVYVDLPSGLGFTKAPWWWPLPVLAVAGLLTAVAVLRLPGGGGHVPYQGLKAGATQPIALPGILLAGLASLGLGLVLGPEAPLIALGSGLAVFAVKRARKDTPDEALSVIAAAAAFAALATIFGSPVIGAVILIEAAGLGGPTLPLVLLPGLMSAGIGSLVFIGMGNWTGLSSSDYALSPFALPAYTSPTFAEFAWTVVLAVVAAVVAFGIVELAQSSAGQVGRKPWVLIPVAGLVVACLAIGFAQITGQSNEVVLFSGESAFTSMFSQASTLSLATLTWLLLFKGVAWALSMGSFRGGPTFPALFMGAVGGLLAAHLPGFSETPAVAAMMGAMAVSILRLPLSSVVIAILLTSSAGIATAPIIIVAVVVAYITIESLSAARRPSPAPTPGAATAPRPGT